MAATGTTCENDAVAVLSRRAVLIAGALAVSAPVHPANALDGPDQDRDQGDLTDLERTDRTQLLAVVTKSEPLQPEDYVPPDLTSWRADPYELRAEVVYWLEQLFSAADEDDIGLRVISGYRSYETQAGTYDYWVRHHGQASADASSARPGHSEHQTGLAVDLDSASGGCYLNACFGETSEGRWVAEQAYRFGFVLSYPLGYRERTGYTYEPWHLRYVGPQVAGQMHDLEVVLLQDYLSPHLYSARLGSLLGLRD